MATESQGSSLPLNGRLRPLSSPGEQNGVRALAIQALTDIPDGFMIVDRDERLAFINQRAREILDADDTSVRQLRGQKLWTAFPALEGTSLGEHLRRELATRQSSAFEFHHPALCRWLLVRVLPFSRGLSVYFLDHDFLDSDERARANHRVAELTRQLSHQSRLFDVTLSNLSDFACVLSREGRFAYANKPLLDLWGLSLGEVVGKTHFELPYSPDIAARLHAQIHHVVASQSGLTGEMPYTSPAGVHGIYEYILRPVLAEDGSVEAVVGSTRNITARREATAQLAESERRFRQLADAMPQVVGALRANGEPEYHNRRWLEYLGLSENAPEAGDWARFIHPRDRKTVVEQWRECVRTGRTFHRELRLRGTGGSYRWFLCRVVPVRDVAGTVERWFGTCTDIDDQVRLFGENLRLLERERAARQAAEEASRLKDHFLATTTHELRTPLNPILLVSTENAARADIAPDVRADFAMIARNATAEARLIDDLLDFNRIVQGKLSLDFRQIDVHAVIREALAVTAAGFAEKCIELSVEFTANPSMLAADPLRLQQVFWNLLRNATKFTPRHGHVRVTTELDETRNQLVVKISDDGLGMTPAEIARLFKAFAQGDHAGPRGSRRYGGLGLGLALSRILVELHAGRIYAASAGREKGSVFTVELPRENNAGAAAVA